ncbi:MAG: CapA family protein [Steroidobacteraceae bacterium]
MQDQLVTLFLCGDVMTGRGIDQILPHPGEPALYESHMRSAVGYVELAERESGSIPRGVDFDYIWGDALAELDRVRPDACIVNLETAITVSDDAWPGKGVHYRMHPANAPCLAAARLDCCVLANNHIMDWGRAGLVETLVTLEHLGIQTAGAGRDAAQAAEPAIIALPGGRRVLVFAFGMPSSGVPRAWRATVDDPGVNLVEDLSERNVETIARQIADRRRDGELVVVSLHWGPNWGYDISDVERDFAHGLIDVAGADLVHGHSSHHVKGIEVYRDKPILYGCGDFLTDYEGIGGYRAFRGDLALMYFPSFEAGGGKLSRFVMTPMRMRRFRAVRAQPDEVAWLHIVVNREGRKFGTVVARAADDTLLLYHPRP